MQYGGNSAAPIFYRAVAYHGILSYICRMNEKLLFRRARPADTERIMEIIRQAQAAGVPVTNYGVLIASVSGILDRVVY